MTDPLLIEHLEDGVLTLTLNRPDAYNALSLALMETLLARLVDLESDPSVRVLVLRGAGRGFCAGHDLREMMAGDDAELQQHTFATCSKLMLKLAEIPQPVIAQVHGIATAAGCQLVATCDLAVAANTARFATPGVNIGLFCSTPMVALTRTLKPKHALEMLLTGEMIDAERAWQMGLINRVVEETALEASTTELAQLLASKSSQTLAIGKAAFHAQMGLSSKDAYSQCSEVMCRNLRAEDAQEGIDAFLNKRPPVWKGR